MLPLTATVIRNILNLDALKSSGDVPEFSLARSNEYQLMVYVSECPLVRPLHKTGPASDFASRC